MSLGSQESVRCPGLISDTVTWPFNPNSTEKNYRKCIEICVENLDNEQGLLMSGGSV